jgi:hypothetical protein
MIIYGINFSSSDLWMLGICGFLIIVLVGYHLTLNAKKHKAFITAASIFRSKVLTELDGIYPIPTNWPKEKMQIEPFLRFKFTKLQSAVEEFKLCLPKRKQRRFINAWVKYYNASGDDRSQSYLHYMSFEENPNYKNNFKRNVTKLLSFAK